MRQNISNRTDKFYIVVFIMISLYFIMSIINSIELPKVNLQWIESLNTVYISILLQALPFVLIGTFISSVLNEFISEEFITKVFPKNRILSYIAAIVFGLFFPVCDCAIAPIVSRLIKKGVPFSAAIMFMLSAPIVNPVVIASTFYAFPNNPNIAAIRVFLGIFTAIMVGETIECFSKVLKTKHSCGHSDNHHKHFHSHMCHCTHFHGDDNHESHVNNKSLFRKMESIFIHMREEFFDVGKFLIVGAFVSVMFQTSAITDWLSSHNLSMCGQLLIMMACGFVLSICSTSDAFIARGFLNQFSMPAVMGFMVLGPMIDIKNILMLSASFSKKTVAILFTTIFIEAFVILYFFLSIPIL